MWTNTVRVYKTDNCNEFGDQTETNMTKQEARGIKKLLKRQSNGEFVISQTDKSNKNSISTNESYIEQGLVHCSKDHVASWKDVEYSKDLVLHHTKALCSVFQVGQSWGEKEETRVTNNMMEKITTVPSVILQQKDHKVTQEGAPPKTRPVCLANLTFNQRTSDLLNQNLKSVINSDPTEEVVSTEEFLYEIKELNAKISEGKIEDSNIIIGSFDVEALYPSIEVKSAIEICRNRVLKSNVKFENINFKWALVYLVLTMSPVDIVDLHLQPIMPRKVSRYGRKPTIKSFSEDKKKRKMVVSYHPRQINRSPKEAGHGSSDWGTHQDHILTSLLRIQWSNLQASKWCPNWIEAQWTNKQNPDGSLENKDD